MPRFNDALQAMQPGNTDTRAYRHWGDGFAGEIHASRIQGYDSGNLSYVDVAVDANGQLKLGASVSVDIGTVDQGNPGASAWPVSLASVPSHPVTQGSPPWSVSQSGAPWSVSGSGVFHVDDNAGSLTVDGSLGRTWALSSGTDTISATATSWPLPTGAATDATLTSIFGAATDNPPVYTVLDHLTSLRKTAEKQQKTLSALLAAAQPSPPPKRQATLLHRS